MKKTYTFILLSLISIYTVSAQWTKEKGNGYYKLSAWYLEADQHYTDTGKIDPNATRGQFNINLYGEYGISNKINVIAYIPFFSRTFQNNLVSGTTKEVTDPGEAINSVGDIDLGIRYGILQKPQFVLSADLLLGLPTGNDAGGSDGSYQTGDGEFNQLLRASLGVPFNLGNTPSYLKAFLGYNNRTQNFSDELRVGGELGVNLYKKLWLSGKINLVESLQNGSLSAQNSNGSIFANNVEYLTVGAEANFYITQKLGVSLNYTSAVSGKIVYAAPSYSAGIFLDIK